MSGRTLMGVHGAGSQSVANHRYLNWVKGSSGQTQVSGTSGWPGLLSTDGYFTSAPASDIRSVLPVSIVISAGEHVLIKWAGTGSYKISANDGSTFTVHSGASFVVSNSSGNLIISGADARVVVSFSLSQTSSSFHFLYARSAGTFAANHTDLVICRESDEASIAAGRAFNPDVTAEYQALNPRALRFMDEQPTNESNQTTFSHRKQTSSFSYEDGVRWEPTAWAGTVGGTDTYTCTAPSNAGSDWVDGDIVHGYWTNANTGSSVTLDDGVRPVKSIKNKNGVNLSVGRIAAASLGTLVYDATLGVLLYYPDGLSSNMPYELQAALCNQVGCDMYLNIPHLYKQSSALSLANLLYPIIPNLWVTFSNEVWNNIFNQTQYGYNAAAALGLTGDVGIQLAGWYGKRYVELISQFESVWGSNSGLKKVIEFQAFGSINTQNPYRVKGAGLGTWGYDVAPNRPVDHCTHFSYATYYYGENAQQFQANWTLGRVNTLITHVDSYLSGDAATQATELQWLTDNIQSTGPNVENLDGLNTINDYWRTMSDEHAKPIVLYEGGLSISPPTTGTLTSLGVDTSYTAKITTFFNAFRNDTRCYDQVTNMISDFVDRAYPYSIYGWYVSWGLKPWQAAGDDLYTSPYQQPWQAMADYNNPVETTRVPVGRPTRRYHDPDIFDKQPRPFSRQYFNELKAAEAAQKAAQERADRLKSRSARQALNRAAQEAAEAIAHAKETEVELTRMTASLEAARSASDLAETVRQANLVIQYAQEIQDIEDEAIALLVLH